MKNVFITILSVFLLWPTTTSLDAQIIIPSSNDGGNFLFKQESFTQQSLSIIQDRLPNMAPIIIDDKIALYQQNQVFGSIQRFTLDLTDPELLNQYRRLLKSRYYPIPRMEPNRAFFRSVFNAPKIDEEKRIRDLWAKAFGFDVWQPYYTAKDIEHWVKERLSIRIFKFKGKPTMEKNKFIYTFKTKF